MCRGNGQMTRTGAATEQEDESQEMGCIIESGFETADFVYFLTRHLAPAFAQLRSLGIFAETCPMKVMPTQKDGRMFCEDHTHKTPYVFYTQKEVDAFEERKSMRLYYHAPNELGNELIVSVLRWFIPHVSRHFLKRTMYIRVGF